MSEQELWHPGKGGNRYFVGRVWSLTSDPKGRGQRQKIDYSCVATCNPTVKPITVICLDRHIPTHFTKITLTGAERENEKREGWKDAMKEGNWRRQWENGRKDNRASIAIHKARSWELARILNPLQWFMEGSVPPIKGFFPQDLHTTPPLKPSSPVALI